MDARIQLFELVAAQKEPLNCGFEIVFFLEGEDHLGQSVLFKRTAVRIED
jgi:hypothetical protein